MKRNLLREGADFLRASSNEIQTGYNVSASRALHLAGFSGGGAIY